MFMLLCFVTFASATLTEDYCWREYDGKIPSDAFPAGLDRNGNPMYIGQTLFEEKLVPGKILLNDINVYIEWNGVEIVQTENNKILCTEQPQKLKWTSANRQNLLILSKEMHFIKGGFQRNFFTFLGRVLTEGETLVGKVVCREGHCGGLFTTKNGKTRDHNLFHVLTYDPRIESVNKCVNVNFY